MRIAEPVVAASALGNGAAVLPYTLEVRVQHEHLEVHGLSVVELARKAEYILAPDALVRRALDGRAGALAQPSGQLREAVGVQVDRKRSANHVLARDSVS